MWKDQIFLNKNLTAWKTCRIFLNIPETITAEGGDLKIVKICIKNSVFTLLWLKFVYYDYIKIVFWDDQPYIEENPALDNFLEK